MGRKIKPVHILMVFIAVIFIAALIASVRLIGGKSSGRTAVITQNGKVLYEIDLENVREPYTLRIDGDRDRYNIIEVRKGEIGVSEASCPDKVCVNMGFISDGLLPVTCLPNKVIIRIVGVEEDDADIAVY